MEKKFNVDEILDSIDSIVSNVYDKSSDNYDKTRTINNYKLFTKKYKSKIGSPETEKIIDDAEKFLKNKQSDIFKRDLKKKKNNSSKKKKKDTLVLKKEHIDEENIVKISHKEETYIRKGNDVSKLENNFLYINKKLKSENLNQNEKIKDLNIQVESFKTDKRYSDLDKKIKLYQEDNSVLRKKIISLLDVEKTLRLKLIDSKINEEI